MNLAAILRKSIDVSAHDAASSPHNLRALPTPAQQRAGNYKVGRHVIAGFSISIENPAGSIRDPAHPIMSAHYGYIRGTVGADGDHLDIFVKPGTPDAWEGLIYVIDQADEQGRFDEAKVMLGYSSQNEARREYLNHHAGNWTGRIIQITAMTIDKFKEWMLGDLSAPVGKVNLARALSKKSKAKRTVKPTPPELIARHKTRVRKAVTKFFAAQGKVIIPRVVAAYAEAVKVSKGLLHSILRKASPSIDEIVTSVKLDGWEALIDTEITPAIEAALIAAGMYAAVEAVKVYTATATAAEAAAIVDIETMTGMLNERAVEYARITAGELITNIADSTRDMVRDKVRMAVEEGWDSERLSVELADSRAFSAARAETIADYELGSALQAGNLIGWQATGVVTGKQWVTAGDEIVSDDCSANEAQGAIPVDEAFQSGDDAPLAHPFCRCSIAPAFIDE